MKISLVFYQLFWPPKPTLFARNLVHSMNHLLSRGIFVYAYVYIGFSFYSSTWPLETRESGAVGRYVVATRPIRPLETVLKDWPALVAPSSRPTCLVCLKKPARNTRCQGKGLALGKKAGRLGQNRTYRSTARHSYFPLFRGESDIASFTMKLIIGLGRSYFWRVLSVTSVTFH